MAVLSTWLSRWLCLKLVYSGVYEGARCTRGVRVEEDAMEAVRKEIGQSQWKGPMKCGYVRVYIWRRNADWLTFTCEISGEMLKRTHTDAQPDMFSINAAKLDCGWVMCATCRTIHRVVCKSHRAISHLHLDLHNIKHSNMPVLCYKNEIRNLPHDSQSDVLHATPNCLIVVVV